MLLLVVCRTGHAIQFAFDYSLDTAGFFSDPARRQTLDLAASAWERFTDPLAAIQPSGGNHWTAYVAYPQGGSATLQDIDIPAGTIRVYVGGGYLAGNLGATTPGVAQAAGSAEWIDLIANRGQTGSAEVGPWGGTIAFNTLTPWYFGSGTAGLDGSHYDFLSVAMHELGHLLGFGSANSYWNAVSRNQFVGAHALALGSSNNPQLELSAEGRHWKSGTLDAATGRITLLDPVLAPGQRRWPTRLDIAAMEDLGWQPAMPGDANCDGRVDTLDVNALVPNFGASGYSGWSRGDFTGDGVVDLADVALLRVNFGTGGASPGPGSIVPEPATASLFMAFMLAMAVGIRRLFSK